MSQQQRDKAISILCAKHLHQSLWLPATPDHPRLRVTFGTTSNFDNTALPAVLFIGPMFGGRWTTLEFDKLAAECGVRMICPDRPGMGGSTPVALNLRMQVWLETAPALLAKLAVPHASLVTHSAGGPYTLATLARQRSILDPEAPFVGFIAPWVSTSDSNAALMALASKLPAALLDSLSSVQGFVNAKVAPALAFSGGLVSGSAALLGQHQQSGEPAVGSLQDAAEKYGVDAETAGLVRALAVQFARAEETTGPNEEAKLCLRKGGEGDWGAGADYGACVRAIAEGERRGAAEEAGGRARLRVFGCFAASDVMIGKGGQGFFEECWRQEGVGEWVDFETRTCEGTNHDSVLVDSRRGGMRDCLLRAAERKSERTT